MRNEENKKKKDLLDLNIVQSSVLGIGVILSISVAFNLVFDWFENRVI